MPNYIKQIRPKAVVIEGWCTGKESHIQALSILNRIPNILALSLNSRMPVSKIIGGMLMLTGMDL